MARHCDLDPRAQDPYVTCPYCKAAPGKRCQGAELSEPEEIALLAELGRDGEGLIA